VVVTASDTKDMFMERVTIFAAQSIWLIWVDLIE
jgi:hypothetical protein